MVFIRHHDLFVHFSPNQIIKYNEYLQRDDNSSNFLKDTRESALTEPIQNKFSLITETIGNRNPIPIETPKETEKLVLKNFPICNDAIEYKVASKASCIIW